MLLFVDTFFIKKKPLAVPNIAFVEVQYEFSVNTNVESFRLLLLLLSKSSSFNCLLSQTILGRNWPKFSKSHTRRGDRGIVEKV